MKRIKNPEYRKVRITITISPEINKVLEEKTSNKSKFIEFALIQYFKGKNIDLSKIRNLYDFG